MTSEIQGGGNNELSTDINVIAAEINAYQRVAGEAIFEIGRRLKHVKETDLVHGQWSGWCKEELGMTRHNANRFIRVYERYSNGTPVYQLPNAVSILDALIPFTDEELMQEYELPTGEKKKPTEMTRREIEDLKRRLKAEQKERERLEIENEELAEREPEVVKEYVENKPDDYDYIKAELVRKERELDELSRRLVDIPETKKATTEPYDRTMDEPYQVERARDFYRMMREVDALYKRYAHLKDGTEELHGLAKYDDDMETKYRKADEFWRMLSDIFTTTQRRDVVDAEIIEIK